MDDYLFAGIPLIGSYFALAGIGIVKVEKVHPSGSWVILDCQGREWLVDKDLALSLTIRSVCHEE